MLWRVINAKSDKDEYIETQDDKPSNDELLAQIRKEGIKIRGNGQRVLVIEKSELFPQYIFIEESFMDSDEIFED